MSEEGEVRGVVFAATLGAGAMIAHQMAGKAARDALFLSEFRVTDLPVMLSGSALFSILAVLATSRLMARLSPGRLIPAAFATSAMLQLALWGALYAYPRAAAVLFFLHIAAFGSILVSGFWSMYNERLDPRTARKHIARVAGGATLGGLVGGLVAERVAVHLSVESMLPILAALHFFCAWRIQRLRRPAENDREHPEAQSAESGIKLLKEVPYLRNLALLILLGTVTAALLDYVFKAWAERSFQQGEDLLRFFAAFYIGVGLATFLVQNLISHRALERLGLSATVSSLPGATAAGGAALLALPGLVTASLVRGAEAVLRSSLFRSSYELFFTPIPERQKRATKGIIDVGFERLGDALGGGIVFLILFLGPAAHWVMMIVAVALSMAGILVARILDRGYVAALEKSMVDRALELDVSLVEDRTTRMALQTMTSFNLPQLDDEPDEEKSSRNSGGEAAEKAREDLEVDSTVRLISILRSGDAERIQQALEDNALPDPAVAGHVIPLLAWDRVAKQAVRTLRNIAPRIQGQLLDTLLDEESEFAIRRRLPRVVAYSPTQRAANGLLRALGDQRFEVRFQAGRALAYILSKNETIEIDEDRVFDAVMREVDVDKRIWDSQRLLDSLGGQGESPIVDDVLRDRGNRSLEHVFTLLSLVLPRDPLRIAFKGLHVDDSKLRGTALEYLESVLPAPIRSQLWPFLEQEPVEEPGEARTREEILSDLIESNESIEISLSELREEERRRGEEG